MSCGYDCRQSADGDDYGRNGPQIRSLFDWIASLDADGWLALTVGAILLKADPQRASAENRAMVEKAANAARLGAEITNRVRQNSMRAGVWLEIERSVVATAGREADLALDAAERFNPDAAPSDVAAAAAFYADPIEALTHALRLRPYISEQEFMVLWGPYEASSDGLAALRHRLPALAPTSSPALLGLTARSGGCLLPAAVAVTSILLVTF